MTSPLNSWLTQEEERVSVPGGARRRLARRLFTTPSPLSLLWFSVAPIVAVIGILALIPRPSSRVPTDVLAAALSVSNLPTGTVEEVTATMTIDATNKTVISRVYTDGTYYLSINDQNNLPCSTWTERNLDGYTLTIFSTSCDGTPVLIRALVGDAMYLDETRTDIDAWQSDPRTELFGLSFGEERTMFRTCDDCAEIPLPWTFAGGTMTITHEMDGNVSVIVEGETPDVRSIASSVPTSTVTRTLRLRPEDGKILERTWEAKMEDGSTQTGRVTYAYRTIPIKELDVPFDRLTWLDAVDSDKNAHIVCFVYSAGTCKDATSSTDSHPVYYIPDGWKEDDVYGGRYLK